MLFQRTTYSSAYSVLLFFMHTKSMIKWDAYVSFHTISLSIVWIKMECSRQYLCNLKVALFFVDHHTKGYIFHGKCNLFFKFYFVSCFHLHFCEYVVFLGFTVSFDLTVTNESGCFAVTLSLCWFVHHFQRSNL